MILSLEPLHPLKVPYECNWRNLVRPAALPQRSLIRDQDDRGDRRDTSRRQSPKGLWRAVSLYGKETIEWVNFAVPLWKETMDEGGLAWDDSSNNRAFLWGSISAAT